MNRSRCGQDGDPVLGIKTAENVTRKKAHIDLLDAIRPLPLTSICWQKKVISLVLQICVYDSLEIPPHINGIPRLGGFGAHASGSLCSGLSHIDGVCECQYAVGVDKCQYGRRASVLGQSKQQLNIRPSCIALKDHSKTLNRLAKIPKLGIDHRTHMSKSL